MHACYFPTFMYHKLSQRDGGFEDDDDDDEAPLLIQIPFQSNEGSCGKIPFFSRRSI